MSRSPDKERFSVNTYALASAAAGTYAAAVKPDDGDYWAQYPLFAVLVVTCIACGVFTVRGLKNRHRRRQLLRNSFIASKTLGDARFASLAELHAAGLTDPSSGPLLCTVSDVPIFAPKQMHQCLQGPPGSSKSTAIGANAIAHLPHLGRSVVVQDIKPELALIFGPELERRGFRVVYNNLAGLADLPHTDSNCFIVLIEEAADEHLQSRLFTTAEGFAFQITPEPDNDAKNKYFRDLERGLCTTLIVALSVLHADLCTPAALWLHAMDPAACDLLLREAAESDVLYGDLAAQARGLLSLQTSHPEHFEGARGGLSQALSCFRPSSDLGLMGTNHAFHPAELRDETKPPVILFDVVPTEALETYGKAIALQQYARLTVLKRISGRAVAFCMDEATNLPVRGLAKEITLLRSRNIVLLLLYQSISELRRVFGEKTAATITANSAEQFLKVSDFETADLLSKRIGDHTVRTTGYGFSDRDEGVSTSTSEHAKRLMPPDEILNMGDDETLVFIPGMRPIRGKKIAYFHIDPFKHWASPNPHEPYAKSPITKLTIQYGDGARDIRAPVVMAGPQSLKKALHRESAAMRLPRVKLVDLRSLLWLPVVSAGLAALIFLGTPHLLFEYSKRPNAWGEYSCTYLGFDGPQRITRRKPCALLTLLKNGNGDAS